MLIPVRPAIWMRLLYPKAIWRGSSFKPQVFLTFDDGPVPEVTPQVLDILRKTKTKATFFCIGSNVQKYPELYKQILNEGHLTANHTMNHKNGFKMNTEQYLAEVNQCSELVSGNFFRPPYGRMRLSQYRKLRKSHKTIMWDVLSKDYDISISPEQCRENVINNCRNGSIIVFHDSKKAARNMLPVLEDTIVQLSQKFTFATIDSI